MRYPVKVVRDTNETFLVTFPDVPGAITYGDTKDDALAHATDALLTVFDALIKDRRDIPEPSATTGLAIELPPLECTKIELYKAMRASNVGKAELARRLDWHLPQVDRVLDIRHGSQLEQLESAFRVLGKRLYILVDDADVAMTPTVLPRAEAARAFKRTRRVNQGRSRRSASSISRLARRAAHKAR